VNSAGKPTTNGTNTRLVLKKGTILTDGTQLQAALQNAQPTDFNDATCTGSVSAKASAPIISGTKAYAGITGSVDLTFEFAFIAPRTSGGKCDLSQQAKSVAQWGVITGTGTVSFG
jgi:hypothetical protein